MTGKPENIPEDWTNWAEVLPYSMDQGGYDVIRKADGLRFGTFVCESDAEAFAKMKNDLLKRDIGI